MDIVALVVAVVALAVAYVGLSRASAVERRLTDAEAQFGRAKTEWNEARSRLEARLQELGKDVHRQGAAVKFAPAMTIAEAMQLHPGVAGILASFQLSGCSNCSISDVDTLEGACRSYGIDQAALMGALAKLVEPAGGDLLQMARAGRN